MHTHTQTDEHQRRFLRRRNNTPLSRTCTIIKRSLWCDDKTVCTVCTVCIYCLLHCVVVVVLCVYFMYIACIVFSSEVCIQNGRRGHGFFRSSNEKNPALVYSSQTSNDCRPQAGSLRSELSSSQLRLARPPTQATRRLELSLVVCACGW